MKYITQKLETKRLVLKRGTKEDYIKVYEYDFTKLRNIDDEFEFVKLDPSIIDEFYSSNDYLNDMFDWIICLKKEGIPIGNITASVTNEENNSISLSYNLHPNFWHNGYMTEAVLEVIDFLFETGFDNIICSYDEGNFRSEGLIKKVGFIPYKTEENSWYKNGKPITKYSYIMNKNSINFKR